MKKLQEFDAQYSQSTTNDEAFCKICRCVIQTRFVQFIFLNCLFACSELIKILIGGKMHVFHHPRVDIIFTTRNNLVHLPLQTIRATQVQCSIFID